MRHPRREESLSRSQIVDAAIEILDSSGEDGLTFRALSERLATGPGALYGHVVNKDDLMAAACDAIVVQTLGVAVAETTPRETLRAMALRLFDAIDAHPWVGSVLMRAAAHSPMVRILERVGQQVRALHVAQEQEWATVAALLNYILGVGGQNAANGQYARTRGLDRTEFLQSMAEAWLQLDPTEYPFTHSVARLLPAHDDRADFVAGIDLILQGIAVPEEPQRSRREPGKRPLPVRSR